MKSERHRIAQVRIGQLDAGVQANSKSIGQSLGSPGFRDKEQHMKRSVNRGSFRNDLLGPDRTMGCDWGVGMIGLGLPVQKDVQPCSGVNTELKDGVERRLP